MRLKKVDYYGFDHSEVVKRFEGDLTFINEFCINGEYFPVAVYKAAKPNRKKKHKDYMLLQMLPAGTERDRVANVRGMNAEEIEKWRYQLGIHCLACDTVLYSINRHHFHGCGCPNETTIDGGRDYIRTSSMNHAKTRSVMLDLLTDEVKDVVQNKLQSE